MKRPSFAATHSVLLWCKSPDGGTVHRLHHDIVRGHVHIVVRLLGSVHVVELKGFLRTEVDSGS